VTTARVAQRAAASPVLFVAAAAVLWALLGVWSTELLDAGLSAAEVACWRALGGGACFVAHAAATGRLRPERMRDIGSLAAFAVVGVSIFYTALPEAIDRGGVGLAFVLLYTAPAFVVVGAALFLGERVRRRTVGLVAVTITGVALVVLPGGGARVEGGAVAWGLLAGLTYSSYYVVVKALGRRLAAETIYAWALPIGGVLLVPFVDWAPKGLREWLLIVGLCTVSTYLPYLSYATGLQRMEAARASVVATLEPVVALLIGVAVYDESLRPLALVGSALVIGAAAVSSRSTEPAVP
jgi:drug/metabolite transporter, DME family